MKTIDADALKDEIRHDLMEYSSMITPDVAIHAVDCIIDRQPAVKPAITLNDLLDLIDYNRESTAEKIQIVGPDDDWNEYDEIRTSSVVLFHLGSAKVSEIEAVGNGVIKVGIDWPTAPLVSKENQP